MQKINDTVSLCEHCCRHIPAFTFKKDESIWIGKTCPKHGYAEYLVEPNAEFYLSYDYIKKDPVNYFIDVSNKCNLTCPHCYQIPDNTSIDPSIEYILTMIESWPDDGYGVSLVGAEPTTRKDLDDLIRRINLLPRKHRKIIVCTNGVNLHKLEYIEKFVGIEDLYWTIGLNHPDYQGPVVRAKQIAGMENCVKLGLPIKGISYTLDGLHQLKYCLQEINDFGIDRFKCDSYRIRVSADIGRTTSDDTIYLSQLVNTVKEICKEFNWSYEEDTKNGIRAHFLVKINGIEVRLIQWPDITTIDLEETQTESWGDVMPGYPITPLIHQVMIRDHVTNKGQMLYDMIPDKYKRIK